MFESLSGRRPGIIGFDDYKKSSVTIPLVKMDGQIFVLFEVRAGSLRHQPGEVCFPGGRVEADESFEDAAIRETMEELCITPSQIEVIAPMDAYMSHAGQMIMPFLVRLKEYEGTKSQDEVQEVFYVPLTYFLENQPQCFKNKVYTQVCEGFPLDKIPGGRDYPWHTGWNDICFYEPSGRIIWGLTARIMKSAADIIREALENERQENYRCKEKC